MTRAFTFGPLQQISMTCACGSMDGGCEELMKETVYDILRSLNIEKNNFTQEEWIDFINELENNVEG
jgi:bacterioferritin-associated ferredoxin